MDQAKTCNDRGITHDDLDEIAECLDLRDMMSAVFWQGWLVPNASGSWTLGVWGSRFVLPTIH